jgi:hypothetical protein
MWRTPHLRLWDISCAPDRLSGGGNAFLSVIYAPSQPLHESGAVREPDSLPYRRIHHLGERDLVQIASTMTEPEVSIGPHGVLSVPVH